jgi:hypothetical protein
MNIGTEYINVLVFLGGINAVIVKRIFEERMDGDF